MADWRDRLNGDPLPWLLDEASPAVRHLALRDLLDRPADDRDVRRRPRRRRLALTRSQRSSRPRTPPAGGRSRVTATPRSTAGRPGR